MSGREWKPGDVALVDSWRGKGQIAFRVGRGDHRGWCVLDGTDSRGLDDEEVGNARPLVVIDPEDGEQLERLAHAWHEQTHFEPGQVAMTAGAYRMQAALRSLVEPERPEEPTGLGAVVEDDKGLPWVRVPLASRDNCWFDREVGAWAEYADIKVVRVHSEGVQP